MVVRNLDLHSDFWELEADKQHSRTLLPLNFTLFFELQNGRKQVKMDLLKLFPLASVLLFLRNTKVTSPSIYTSLRNFPRGHDHWQRHVCYTAALLMLWCG